MLEVVIGVVGTAVGGLVGAIFMGITNLRKEKANEKLAENQQAFVMMKDLYAKMEKQIDEIEAESDKQQILWMNCHEENIKLKMENDLLKERSKSLLEQIGNLNAKIFELNKSNK